jgi:hypothetical protein
MDNRPVTFLSSFHDQKETMVVMRKIKDGTSTEIFCSEVVAEYNKIMGAVNKFNQLRKIYALGETLCKMEAENILFSGRCCHSQQFVLWKINKRENEQHDQITYRIRLARQLIAGISSRKRRGQKPVFLAKKGKVPDDVRLASVEVHQPVLGDTYRRCRHCSTKAAEKRTRCICTNCQVTPYIDPCFRKFHVK